MSAKTKLTAWVTLMVLMLSAMVLVFVLVINRHSLPEDPASYLVNVVIDNANDVEFDRGTFEWDDLSVYKRGVYCSFYNTNGDLLLSANKEDMDFSDQPFEANRIREVSCGGRDFYIYDMYVDMEVSGLWIRGAVLTDSRIGITDTLLRLTLMILPFLLLLTALGARLISGRTFRPVEQIVRAANSINEADDLTQRIGLKKGSSEIVQLAGAFDSMFERLEKAFETERQFTSDASHELRTPTTVILAECDRALRKDGSAEEYRQTIGNIEEQGRRMSELIEELLGITRLQQGTEKYPLRTGDLSEFTAACADEFVPADGRGIHFVTEIEDGVVCDFNASLMSRLIYNLLQNAYKYGRDNGYVRLSLVKKENSAELSVRDNGIGIKSEDLEKVWMRFWQADDARHSESGSGLGLAMVREIAGHHGGTAAVESNYGKGSTFKVSIPLKPGKSVV